MVKDPPQKGFENGAKVKHGRKYIYLDPLKHANM